MFKQDNVSMKAVIFNLISACQMMYYVVDECYHTGTSLTTEQCNTYGKSNIYLKANKSIYDVYFCF